MKKLIIAVVAAMILIPAFTACKKSEQKCYFVTYTTPGHTDSEGKLVNEIYYECYKWMSETEIDAYKKSLEETGYTGVTVKSVSEIGEESRNKTMADCLALGE